MAHRGLSSPLSQATPAAARGDGRRPSRRAAMAGRGARQGWAGSRESGRPSPPRRARRTPAVAGGRVVGGAPGTCSPAREILSSPSPRPGLWPPPGRSSTIPLHAAPCVAATWTTVTPVHMPGPDEATGGPAPPAGRQGALQHYWTALHCHAGEGSMDHVGRFDWTGGGSERRPEGTARARSCGAHGRDRVGLGASCKT